jgi:hypothetical protein
MDHDADKHDDRAISLGPAAFHLSERPARVKGRGMGGLIARHRVVEEPRPEPVRDWR